MHLGYVRFFWDPNRTREKMTRRERMLAAFEFCNKRWIQGLVKVSCLNHRDDNPFCKKCYKAHQWRLMAHRIETALLANIPTEPERNSAWDDFLISVPKKHISYIEEREQDDVSDYSTECYP